MQFESSTFSVLQRYTSSAIYHKQSSFSLFLPWIFPRSFLPLPDFSQAREG